jgi:hypothetical protein
MSRGRGGDRGPESRAVWSGRLLIILRPRLKTPEPIMPRNRLPLHRAEVSGAIAKNRQRYRGRTAPAGTRPLGDPPGWMTEGQRAAWEAFRSEVPWLHRAHRAIVEVACVSRARLDANPDIAPRALQSYGAVLSKLGATPVDAERVGSAASEPEDPVDRFFS